MDINELEKYKKSDAVKFHRDLNPKLWDNEDLRDEVRLRLLDMADDFREFLGVDNLQVKDITISGSNAAYNYTPTSDIDLHLVVDVPKLKDEIYRELFNAKKYQYNDQHDYRIGDHEVELYVQPSEDEHHSQGIYSVQDSKWVRVPSRRAPKIDDVSVKNKYNDLGRRIEKAVSRRDLTDIEALYDKIINMRSAGLEQTGEFGVENLVFKLPELFIPPGNKIPSSGMLNEKTSPAGTPAENKVVLEVLSCNTTEPAVVASVDSIIIPLNLVLPAKITPVLPTVCLTAFTSDFIF